MRLEVVLLLGLVAGAVAGDWPQFRGPAFDGSAAEVGLPVSWSAHENLVWRTPLPGPGAGTPAVVGERVYVPAFDRKTGEVVALGLDRRTGRLLWRVPAGAGVDSRDHGRENFGSAPSPAARGDRAWFMFGNGTVLCVDASGRTVWKRDLAPPDGFQINFGYASSPLLLGDTLYVEVLQRAPSRLIALDAATGRERWSHARTTTALEESQEAYTSPVPFTRGDRVLVLVFGGDRLTAHEPADGAVAWQWTGYNPRQNQDFRVVPSPLVHGDTVFINAPKGHPLHALKLSTGQPAEAWRLDSPVTDVPTPAWGGDGVVLLSDKQHRVASVDPQLGTVRWNTRVNDLGILRASPLVADGKVYVIDNDGQARVLSLADGSVLGRASMGEGPCQAGPLAAGGLLYLRTAEALWCVGTRR